MIKKTIVCLIIYPGKNFVLLVVWLLVAWDCFVLAVYYGKDLTKLLKFKQIQFSQKENNTGETVAEAADYSFARSKNNRSR